MDIALSGVLAADGHTLTQRVYYEDTDFSGVVYHARYLHFLERGRTDFLRCLGIRQSEMADAAQSESLVFVVHRMEIDFRASARMDDVLAIITRPQTASGAKLVLAQQIYRQDTLLITALVTVAIINGEGRPRRLPQALQQKLLLHAPANADD